MVLDVIEKTGVKLMIGFNRRFDPNYAKVQQMVKDGKIGDPHILKITSRDPAPPPAALAALRQEVEQARNRERAWRAVSASIRPFCVLPLASTVKPWVSTFLYGATPLMAAEVNSED